jgi:hypothetical protein
MVVWPKHAADNLNKIVKGYWNRVALDGNHLNLKKLHIFSNKHVSSKEIEIVFEMHCSEGFVRLSGHSRVLSRFEVLTAVIMRCSIFWDITACSPPKVNSRFGGTYSFLKKGLAKIPAWKQVVRTAPGDALSSALYGLQCLKSKK